MTRARGSGEAIAAEMLGPLTDSTTLLGWPGALAGRIAEDGYVFLRGVIPEGDVAAARAEVLGRLAEVGEVAEPVAAGCWSGTSRRAERAGDLGRFWQSVCEGPQLHRVTHGPALAAAAGAALGAAPLAQDFLYLRAGVPGTFTDLHCDYPFFARRSERIVTCWVPLGEVPIEQGPLAIVEGSHRFADLIAEARAIDVVAAPEKRAALVEPIAAFARRRAARLLTADFLPGDALIFGMTTFHASLDNHTPEPAIRLSFDLRIQAADAPRDERFFGPDPIGITGRGYAELNGAKPLGESWHQR